MYVDLSFNCIEKIDGLHTLTKLKDLTLHHNFIQKLENLDAQTKLEVLSIGDNNLESLEEVRVSYFLLRYTFFFIIDFAVNLSRWLAFIFFKRQFK